MTMFPVDVTNVESLASTAILHQDRAIVRGGQNKYK